MTANSSSSPSVPQGPACARTRPPSRGDLAWAASFLVILLAAVAIRLWYVSQPIRFDEAFSYLHYASKPLWQVVSTYDTTNNHIFNSVLMHACFRLLGDDPWALRLPAMAFGVLLVPAIYWTARRMFDRHAAIFAAAMAGSSSIMIEFSVNARGYSFLLLLFTVLAGLAQGLRHNPRPAAWIGFGALASLGFWAIPIMLYPFVMVELWLVMSLWVGDSALARNKGLSLLGLSVAAAGLCSLALYLPVLATKQFHGMAVLNPDMTQKSLSYFLAEMPMALWNFALLLVRDLSPPVAILLVAFLILSPLAHGRAAKHRIPFLWAILLGLAVIMPLYRVVPYPRVLLFLHPMFLVAACSVFTWLMKQVRPGWFSRWGFPAAAAAYAVLASLLVVRIGALETSNQTGALPDAEAVARFLEAERRPGDSLLMAHPSNEIMEYQFLRHGFAMDEFQAVDNAPGGRILILVNLAHRQRLWYFLNNVRLDPARSPMRLVASFDSALVVEVLPR